jgi:hypothetical protein
MSVETIFRIAFWALFGRLVIMQMYFASRVQQEHERVTASQVAIQREGLGYIVTRIIGSLAACRRDSDFLDTNGPTGLKRPLISA